MNVLLLTGAKANTYQSNHLSGLSPNFSKASICGAAALAKQDRNLVISGDSVFSIGVEAIWFICSALVT